MDTTSINPPHWTAMSPRQRASAVIDDRAARDTASVAPLLGPVGLELAVIAPAASSTGFVGGAEFDSP
jgi:hypothetical protein